MQNPEKVWVEQITAFLQGGTRGTPLKKGPLKINQQGLGDLWMESVGEQGLKPGEGGWQVMSPLRLENGRKGQEEREPEITIYPKSKSNC